MRKLFAAIAAATIPLALFAQTAQVVPQFGLDSSGTTRRLTVRDPLKAGADKMVPIGTLDAANVFAVPVAQGGTGATTATGTGSTVRSNSPVLVTPALGTPSAAVLTNASGLPLTSGVTGTLPVANGGTGVTSATGTGSVVLSNSPTLVSPALGTPASGVATNLTGTAAGLTAGSVTINANLTGPITSTGNATAVAAQTGTGSTFVMQASPTLTTPNLGTPSAAVLTNATGLPIATGVSGLGAGVANALAQSPTGSGAVVLATNPSLSGVSLASGTIAATPAAATDIANKAYVDAAVAGLSVKNSVQFATAAALPAYSYSNGSSGVGATLTASANGALSIDGGAPALNDRILVKNESTGSRHGLYLVTATGSAGAPWVLTRSTDADSGSELRGAFTFVEAGTVNASTGWANTNSSSITIGTTAVNFSQFSGAGTYLAGTGLNLTGSSFSLADTTVTPGSYTLGGFTADQQGRLTAASSAATTGSGNVVLATSPSLTTPNLGTPSAATLTNATGLPIATGVAGLGAGVATALAASPTGSGGVVLATSPSLTTPNLGTPSAATLTNATGLPIVAGTTGTLTAARGGTNLTGFTANGVAYASSTSQLATGSALTFDGTNLATTGNAVALQFNLSGTSPAPSIGMYRPATSEIAFAISAADRLRITTSQLIYGIGGATGIAQRVQVSGGTGAGGGGLIAFAKDVNTYNYIGNHSAVTASGTSNDLLISTIAGLSIRFSPASTERVRFHASGGVSINNTTDPGAGNLSVTGGISATGDLALDKTITAGGTTGAQTINKNAGSVNFAAAATSLTVTDSRVTANSVILCTAATNDSTLKSVACVPAAGSFTMHANAAATAETRVNFLIVN